MNLAELFTFEDPNEVYIMMAIARKKNNPELRSEEAVTREVVRTPEEFGYKLRRLKSYVENFDHPKAKPEDFNFYITFNPRNALAAYHNFKKELIEVDRQLMIKTEHTRLKKIDKMWVDCLQKPEARKRRQYFNIDVDTPDVNILHIVLDQIRREMDPVFVQKTRHGFHVLLKPAEYRDLRDFISLTEHEIEFHRDRLFFIGTINDKHEIFRH